jgi:hypothetical protein
MGARFMKRRRIGIVGLVLGIQGLKRIISLIRLIVRHR